MEIFDVRYNNDTGGDFGVFMYDYPKISPIKKNYSTYPIPGRCGELIGEDEYLSNIEITCIFSIISESLMPSIRELKRWLRGTGELSFTEEPDLFYIVKKIQHGDIERELRRFGKFTVSFICDPAMYIESGKEENSYSNLYEDALLIDSDDETICEGIVSSLKGFTIRNTNGESYPTYKITGSGYCHFIINGLVIQLNIDGSIIIDTMRKIAYSGEENLSHTITGDYEGMALKEGKNEIIISPEFQLSIIPNWRVSE